MQEPHDLLSDQPEDVRDKADITDKQRSADNNAAADFRQQLIRNRDLTLADVPYFDEAILDVEAAQWDAVDRFALSFDGYAFTGLSPEALSLIFGWLSSHVTRGGPLPIADLTWLRTLLFFDQRTKHASYSGADEWPRKHGVYVRVLLDAIRRAIRNRPELIQTRHLRRAQVPDPIDGDVWRFARTFDPYSYFVVEESTDDLVRLPTRFGTTSSKPDESPTWAKSECCEHASPTRSGGGAHGTKTRRR